MISLFEEVKQSTNILNVVERYCRDKPRKKGRHYFILSPFKNEKTASCVLYSETNSYFDFSSGNAGDCIKLVSQLFNISNYEAALKLAEDFGIEVKEKPDKKKIQSIIRQNEELEHTSIQLKNRLETLYNTLCILYRCFKEIKEKADQEKVDKLTLEYQFIKFNYDFFDRYSNFMSEADIEKQIEYTLHIDYYYNSEWRCFKDWIKQLI